MRSLTSANRWERGRVGGIASAPLGRIISRLREAVSVIAIALVSAPALADTYNWTFDDTPYSSGSGTLTTGAAVSGGSPIPGTGGSQSVPEGGGFAITGITGTFNGYTILGLSDDPDFAGDNILYPAGNGSPASNGTTRCPTCLPAYLDKNGVAFVLDAPPLLIQGPYVYPAIYFMAYIPGNGLDDVVCCYFSDNEVLNAYSADATFTLVDVTPQVNCFLKGTHVLTSRGEIEIEKLRDEDEVVTARGGHRRIKRIQRQILELSLDHMPVRISRHALDDNTPHRDLYLSPAHCVYIDGVLIPVIDLVDGNTVARDLPEAIGEIEYYHIELETHEVIFAEGAQAETLLADGMNRCAPYFARDGGRSELKAALRRIAWPLVDVRDPIQVAYDRIAVGAAENAD
jgi:Hint domain